MQGSECLFIHPKTCSEALVKAAIIAKNTFLWLDYFSICKMGILLSLNEDRFDACFIPACKLLDDR